MKKRIIGIDPGTRITGYGVIETTDGTTWRAIDFGCIRPPTQMMLSKRYLVIFDDVSRLLELHSPEAICVETQFVGQRNVSVAIKLGMARGAVLIAASKQGVSTFEYAPTTVKRAVAGTGRASKQQVQGMMQRLLNLTHIPEPEDAADALAIALCHAHGYTQLKPLGIEV